MLKRTCVLAASLAASFCLSADGASASQAWGASVGNSRSVTLYPLQTSNGLVGPGGASSSGGSFAFTGIDDLASDPARHPTTVWAVRLGGAGNELIAVDPYRDEVLSYALLDAPTDVLGLAINPVSGVMYGTAPDALYTIDPLTGETTLVSAMTTPVTDGLGFDSLGRLFGIERASLYEIDVTDGSTSLLSTMSANFAVDLAVDPDDGVMYALGPNVYDLVTIDLTDGSITSIGPSLARAGGFAFTAVPEPVAAGLLTAALLAATASRQRRSSN